MKKYGIEIQKRPKVKPNNELNLSTPEGVKLVRLQTEVTLLRNKKTFDKLANM